MKIFFHVPHFRCCYVILLVACLSAIACKKSGSVTPGEAKKGYTNGTVTDTKGNPMAGIEVVVENTLLGNHRYGAAVTDDKGQYRIQLSQVGTFHASAYVVKTFNGKEYRMALHPDNDDAFSNEGAVRNFQWKLSGQKPDQMQGFYGARAGTALLLSTCIMGCGYPLKLRVTDTNKPYAPAMNLDFEPVTLYGDNMGYIQYNF